MKRPCYHTLIAAKCNHSTVFVRWRQCGSPSNTQFLEPTLLTVPNGNSVSSANALPHPPHTKMTLSVGYLDLFLIHGFLIQLDSRHKWHLARISCFSIMHAHYQWTDLQSEHGTQPVRTGCLCYMFYMTLTVQLVVHFCLSLNWWFLS